MDKRIISNIEVTVTGEISNEEISTYLTRLQARSKFKIITADVAVNGEFIDVTYETQNVPFERIRRITGYLVGTTAKWCDSKRAEEHDRVKHNEIPTRYKDVK